MHPAGHLTLLSLLFLLTSESMSSPASNRAIHRRSIDTMYLNNNASPNQGKVSRATVAKKDVFVSRGWGAGGMPFSVLYMSPHSSKTPAAAATYSEEPYRPLQKAKEPVSKGVPHTRNSLGGARRKPYSIIPQLFVSYGWGPIGK